MVADEKKDTYEKDQEILIRGEGWERQFSIEEHRLSEYVELYESLGYEVRVEAMIPDEKEECQECIQAEFDNLRTIYTRRIKKQKNRKDLDK